MKKPGRKLGCIGGFVVMMLLLVKISAQGVQTAGILSLVIKDSVVIAGTDRGGVFRSIDKGETWSAVGLGGVAINDLCRYGTTVLAGGEYSGLFRSTDNGLTWLAVDSIAGISALAADNATFYAGMSVRIHRSTDDGRHWTECSAFTETAHGGISSLDAYGTTLLAGTNLGGFVSTDNGTTWNADELAGRTACFARKGEMVFAGVGNRIARSTDSGIHWKWIGARLSGINVRSLVISGERIIAGTDNGIYLSSVNDTEWTAGDSILTKKQVNALAADSDTVIAGTGTGGIFRSTDNGTTWAVVITGFTTTGVSTLPATGGKAFAAYNFSTPKGVSRSVNGGRLPVTITFTLSQPQMVECSVYSLSGCRVALLANKRFLPGEHRISWNPQSSTKGCYVVKTSIGTVFSEKMVTILR